MRSLPEEPLHNACVGKLSVGENLALRNFDRPPLRRGWFLSGAALKAQALAGIEAFKVKTPGPVRRSRPSPAATCNARCWRANWRRARAC